MKEIILTIKGMHCPSCELLLKEVLEETPGVRKADFSWKEKSGIVEYDETAVSPDKLNMLIELEGYKVENIKYGL